MPFVHGGAEILVRELAVALAARGHDAQVVSVPFQDHPREELFAGAETWRLLDVTKAAGGDVDLVIATKFPTYFARHPRKVLWLVHQHRAAYELCGTRFSDFSHAERDVAVRRRLIETDTRMLRECVGCFTIARTVSDRMLKYNAIASEALYNPPKLAGGLLNGDLPECHRAEEDVRVVQLSANRGVEQFAGEAPGMRLVIAGDGSARQSLRIDRAARPAGSGHLARPGGRQPARRALREPPGGVVRALPGRLRIRHARGLPVAQAGDYGTRFRRPAGIRAGRRH